jgi:hypothetical protein
MMKRSILTPSASTHGATLTLMPTQRLESILYQCKHLASVGGEFIEYFALISSQKFNMT